MRYAIYARKSSESEDRQIQSIDDQINILRDYAQQRGLHVIEEITEAHSAKAPYQRTGFERLLKIAEQGQIDAILCWHFNRLSRNPIDSGKLSWMIQMGILKEIHTPDRGYRTGDNVFVLAVEQGMANQFILDLQKVILRGMQSKREKGWFPHKAPIGYLNDVLQHTIHPDPSRFDLLQRAWKLLLTGSYTIPEVVEELNQGGFTTRSKVPLRTSTAYHLFSNPFYAGYFEHDGKWYRGNHL